MSNSGDQPRLYEFGPFRLLVEERVLLNAGQVVKLTPKVFDTLLFLIERRGRLVRKEELIEGLWPDSFVEERNLAQNIFLLRRALGDGERGRRYIQTVPKGGYRFIAEVRAPPRARGAEGLAAAGAPATAGVTPGTHGGAAGALHPGGPGPGTRMTKKYALLSGLVLVAVCGISVLLYRRASDPAPAPPATVLRGGERKAGLVTKNKDANRYLQTGLHLWNQRTPDGIKKSVLYFQKVVEQEPGDALAYALLADSYYLIHFYGMDGFAEGEAYSKSVEAAATSLRLDPSLAEANGAMAMILRLNSPVAETYFRKSIELDPSLATTRHRFGQFLVRNRRLDEGLAELRRAHELAPTSRAINGALAHTLFIARRYDEAIRLCRVWLDVDANEGSMRAELIMSYIQQGLRAEAAAELQRLGGDEMGRLEALRMEGYMHALSGNDAEALRLALAFEKGAQGWPAYSTFHLAAIYAAGGRAEEALRYLDRACALINAGPEHQKEYFLNNVHFGPQFDRLRGDTRFVDLLRRHGLT